MEYSLDCLGHLTKMAATPIYGKTKYVLLCHKTLTYFNIIKEIRWAPQDLQVL